MDEEEIRALIKGEMQAASERFAFRTPSQALDDAREAVEALVGAPCVAQFDLADPTRITVGLALYI